MSVLEGPDLRVETRFVAGGLVLVNQAFHRKTVEHRSGLLERVFGRGLVAGIDGADDLFDLRAHHATTTGVVLAALFGLAGALCCLR